jgi:hypothetical protein
MLKEHTARTFPQKKYNEIIMLVFIDAICVISAGEQCVCGEIKTGLLPAGVLRRRPFWI